MKFFVVIRAVTETECLGPPDQIKFELNRPARPGFIGIKTGFLITDPADPDHPVTLLGGKTRYTYRTHRLQSERGVKDWIITKVKGKWDIKVKEERNWTSSTTFFKIKKRDQIVQVAATWPNNSYPAPPPFNCNRFVGKVLKHVGIVIKDTGVSEVWRSTEEYGPATDGLKAAVVVYRTPDPTTRTLPWGDTTSAQDSGLAAHVAIRMDDGTVVDVNCGLHQFVAGRHAETAPLTYFPNNTNPYPNPDKKDRTPPELKQLDTE